MTADEAVDREKMELVEALKVTRSALMEIRHAQIFGPQRYTKGANGMYMQVRMWMQRGLDATRILDKYEAESYSGCSDANLDEYSPGANSR